MASCLQLGLYSWPTLTDRRPPAPIRQQMGRSSFTAQTGLISSLHAPSNKAAANTERASTARLPWIESSAPLAIANSPSTARTDVARRARSVDAIRRPDSLASYLDQLSHEQVQRHGQQYELGLGHAPGSIAQALLGRLAAMPKHELGTIPDDPVDPAVARAAGGAATNTHLLLGPVNGVLHAHPEAPLKASSAQPAELTTQRALPPAHSHRQPPERLDDLLSEAPRIVARPLQRGVPDYAALEADLRTSAYKIPRLGPATAAPAVRRSPECSDVPNAGPAPALSLTPNAALPPVPPCTPHRGWTLDGLAPRPRTRAHLESGASGSQDSTSQLDPVPPSPVRMPSTPRQERLKAQRRLLERRSAEEQKERQAARSLELARAAARVEREENTQRLRGSVAEWSVRQRAAQQVAARKAAMAMEQATVDAVRALLQSDAQLLASEGGVDGVDHDMVREIVEASRALCEELQRESNGRLVAIPPIVARWCAAYWVERRASSARPDVLAVYHGTRAAVVDAIAKEGLRLPDGTDVKHSTALSANHGVASRIFVSLNFDRALIHASGSDAVFLCLALPGPDARPCDHAGTTYMFDKECRLLPCFLLAGGAADAQELSSTALRAVESVLAR